MLAIGDRVDRYLVEAVLGTGGTAVVYRVRHEQLGTQHALKVLSVTSDVIRERMLQEGRVQAALRHLNVVAVTDVIDVQGQPGLLMEYIEGPPLDEAIRKYRINPWASETLFKGVLSGVRIAHRHGLVHRDLKPANVLLSRTPDGFVPKVTDFGLAKVLEETTGGKDGHTRSGVALGTPAYMAPEQVRDAASVDQRADIFALGCLLYELFTKRRVFPGDDTIAIFNQVLDGRYVPPRLIVADIEDRLENAIQGCLLVEKEKRIPDTETLLKVLQGDLTWEIPPLEPMAPAEIKQMLAFPDLNAPEIQLSAHSIGGFEFRTDEQLADPTRSRDPIWASLPGESYRRDAPSLNDESRKPVPAPARSRLQIAVFFGIALVVMGGSVAAGIAAIALYAWDATRPGPEGPSVSEIVEAGAPPAVPDAGVPPGAAPYTRESPTASDPATSPGSTAVAASSADPTPAATGTPRATPGERPTPPTEETPEPEAPRTVSVVEPPEPPKTPTLATVKILSKPHAAVVRIDGEEMGRTPAKLGLKPGSHSVELVSGEDRGTFQISVHSEVENKWCYNFWSAEVIEGLCP